MNTEIEKAKINFKGLLNNDINIRLKAAKYFSWLARNEYSIFRKEVFENPETYKKLYPLLNDNEPKIVCEIIAALGCANERYRNDAELENKLLKLFESKNKEILYMTIIWTSSIEKEEKYKYVLKLLEETKSKKYIAALCMHFNKNTNNDIKNIVQRILLKRIDNLKNEKTEKIIVKALIDIVTGGNIKVLKEYIEKSPEKMKETFKVIIDRYFGKAEKERLMKKLNIG